MIWKEARICLVASGLQVTERAYGLEGYGESAAGRLRFQMGGSSGGGCELSIWRDGPGAPLPGGPVRWFQRPSVAALTGLVVAAQRRCREGLSASLFDGLLELDRSAGK